MRSAGYKWSQATVWSVEKGERRPLRLAEAVDLAQIFDRDVSVLLQREAEAVLIEGIGAQMRRVGESMEAIGEAVRSYEREKKALRNQLSMAETSLGLGQLRDDFKYDLKEQQERAEMIFAIPAVKLAQQAPEESNGEHPEADNGSWRARYRDDAGKEHARHFPRKIDAQKWLDGVTVSVVTGSYVDPKSGKVTLRTFYAEWSTRQIWAAGTSKAMSLAVRSCTFADVEFRNLKRSHVEAWVKKISVDGLAPGTVKTRFNNVRSVLRGARNDRMLATDPAESVTLPRARKSEHAMTIPSPGDVGKLLMVGDDYFRPFIAMCAFAGLRLGEAAAVQLTDIDFLRRTLKVQRQVQRAGKVEVSITLA
jgi:hypothetical protein